MRKPYSLAQPFVLSAHVGDLAQIEREPQRIERRAPQLALASVLPSNARLSASSARPLCAGRRYRPRSRRDRAAGLRSSSWRDGSAARCAPGAASGASVGADGDELAEHRHAGAEIVFLKGGIGVAPDLRRRLGRRAGVVFDLRLELDGASSRSRVLKALSAACAVSGAKANSAAARPARTSDIMRGPSRRVRNVTHSAADLKFLSTNRTLA